MTSVQAASARRRIRGGGVSMATRLAGSLLAISMLSLAVATIVGLGAGFQLGRDIYQSRLTTLGVSASSDVAGQLNSLAAASEALAASPETTTAVVRFSDGLSALRTGSDTDVAATTAELIKAYGDTYLSPGDSATPPVPIGEIVTRDPGALYLQSKYSIEPVPDDGTASAPSFRVADDPSRLENADDGSDWTAVHAEYHSSFRRMADELGLEDLYLVSSDGGRVVYSVDKRPDLGTSLVAGPFSGSVLANTVDAVIKDPAAGTVFSDLNTYNAAPGHVVGVVASPVFDGDQFVGVVAFMYDAATLTTIVTDGVVTGPRDQGDVYLIGPDGTLRSDPRTYLDDPTAFLDASETSGQITAAQRDEITAAGTTVLIQPAPRAALASAADGDTSVNRESSVTGSRAIAVVTPLEVSDLGWAVVSEVSPAGAESALGDFRDILIVGTSLFAIAIAFFAVAWATRIMRPVKMISERLGSIETNSEPLVIPAQSPIEMHDLAASFTSMANTLERQQLTLAVAREERLGLMREMLPHAIADRLARGDLEGVDTVPQASVVVVVVLGLGELVRAGDGARDIIEQLHSELDDLADAHGLDRIKVVGDAYFAACGHDRPFIDHAPRVVAFATDARDAIRAVSRTAGLGPGLDAATGVQTGAVTVGMTGGARLVYDVWGDTVTAAHQLARRARPGTVLVSDATHSALPEEIPAAAVRQDDGTTVWSLSETVMGAMG